MWGPLSGARSGRGEQSPSGQGRASNFRTSDELYGWRFFYSEILQSGPSYRCVSSWKAPNGRFVFCFFFGREKLGACSDENELLPLFDHEEQEPVSLGYLLVSCSLSWFPMLFPFDFLPPCQSGIGPYHSALKEDLLEVVLEG